jgi:hypothetical protein
MAVEAPQSRNIVRRVVGGALSTEVVVPVSVVGAGMSFLMSVSDTAGGLISADAREKLAQSPDKFFEAFLVFVSIAGIRTGISVLSESINRIRTRNNS